MFWPLACWKHATTSTVFVYILAQYNGNSPPPSPFLTPLKVEEERAKFTIKTFFVFAQIKTTNVSNNANQIQFLVNAKMAVLVSV